jgi:hypothetical protein
MARRRFGLPDAYEADVVYIRAHLGSARGKTVSVCNFEW